MAHRSTPSPGGFVDNGARYVVTDPHWIETADADLFSASSYLKVSHRGGVAATFLQPNATEYAETLRAFYVRDEETGEFWSAPYDPVQREPDAFEFSVGLGDIAWRVDTDEIEVVLRLTTPWEDPVEVWTASVTNRGARPRKLSFIPCFPIGSVGLLAHRAAHVERLSAIVHEYFPYYVRWQDYEPLSRRKNMVFGAATPKPNAYEVNQGDFLGGRGWHDPAALRQRRLGRGETIHEPSVAAWQYFWTLATGKSRRVGLLFGPAHDHAEIKRLIQKYLREPANDRALNSAVAMVRKHEPTVRIETPDEELNHFVNHWLPRRAAMIGKTMRHTFCPQGRNVIQDASGTVYTNPADGRELLLRAFAHQRPDGWLPHGMPMHPDVDMMPIGKIPHRDTNIWAAIAVHFYLAETGDFGFLDETAPFTAKQAEPSDPVARNASTELPPRSDEAVSVYDHVCRALEWSLADRSDCGLSLLGQGDWNDPLNMAGKDDKGESIWLSEALAYSFDCWAEVAEFQGDTHRARHYSGKADELRQAINEYAWDGKWYARGTTDAGRWFGVRTDKEGRIYLNSQSWAILCGAAAGERLKQCVAAVDQHLMTTAGPMTLHPPFQGMRPEIGKLTQKPPGTGENGSVYCHAVTFYAHALFSAGYAEEGFRLLRNLLPGGGENTVERCGQLPLYIPNYYRGTGAGASAGRSSHAANTGTVAWYYRTVISRLLGVRGELDGLRIDPQIPKSWRSVVVWRKWRGAQFEICLRRSKRVKRLEVSLDNEAQSDNLIPPQAAGSKHRVVAMLPA